MQVYLLILLLILGICSISAAPPQWNFVVSNESMNLIFDATIGTPPQTIQMVTHHFSFYHPLQVADSNTDPEAGVFNPNASKTFTQSGISYDEDGNPNGILGTDTLTIAGGQLVVEKNALIDVIQTGWDIPGYCAFTLARSNDGSISFVSALLATIENVVISLTYNDWDPKDDNPALSGALTIGEVLPDNCNKDWTFVSEVVYKDKPTAQWGININSLNVGKYTSLQPAQAFISPGDLRIGFPASIYDTVLKTLGSRDSKTIACDSTVEIVFNLDNGLVFRLTPADYVDHSEEKSKGSCSIRASRLEKSVEGFILPVTILRQRCMMLDYAKMQIGFATRKK